MTESAPSIHPASGASHPAPRLTPRRALIIEDETLPGFQIRSALEKLGHTVIGQASDSQEAAAMYRDHQADLVLVDIRLGPEDGIDLAAKLLAQRRCPMVIVSAFSDETLHVRAAAAGAFGYLIKPVTKDALAAQIVIAVRRFGELETLREEKESLATTLETRKLVERAKGVLMDTQGMKEQEAFRKIQQLSMNTRKSMREIAQAILLTAQIEK